MWGLRWRRTTETHVDPHDLPDRRVKLLRVVEVHRVDVRPADVLLRVRVLGGHLRGTREDRHHPDERRRVGCEGTRVDHLSGGGLPPEELVIQRAVRGVELGLQEDAAIGDGL